MKREEGFELKLSYERLHGDSSSPNLSGDTSSPTLYGNTSSPTLSAHTKISSLTASISVGLFDIAVILYYSDLANVSASEVFFDFTKTEADSFNVLESLFSIVEKVTSDAGTLLDQNSFSFDKPLSNSFETFESTQKNLTKTSVEFSFVSDNTVEEFIKVLVSSSSFSDEIESLSVIKNIFEQFFVTDDVDGKASILDDQEIFFTKQRKSLIFAKEETNVVLHKSITTASLVEDVQDLNFEKLNTENLPVQEAFSYFASKHIANIFESSEAAQIEIEKVLFNLFTSEESSTISFEKALTEIAEALEESFFLLEKTKADIFNAIEEAFVDYSKFLNDSSTIEENQTINFNKSLSNSARANELKFFELEKTKSDSAFLAENNNIKVDKVLFDISNVQEDRLLTFVKDLNDFLFVTDDIDGKTSILDDQEITFTKITSHKADIADNISEKTIEKELVNAFSIEENSFLNTQKLLSEFAISLEAATLTTEKILESQSVTQEDINYAFEKQLQDSWLVHENSFASFSKTVENLVNLPESFNFDIEKELFDTITSTDDIDGEASILDDQKITFIKQKSELLSLTEDNFFTIEKGLSETSEALETVGKLIEKNFSNFVSVSEIIDIALDLVEEPISKGSITEDLFVAFEKTNSEQLSAIENPIITLVKDRNDTVLSSEDFFSITEKPFANIIEGLEDVSLENEKALTNVNFAEDTEVKDIVKYLANTVFVTDDVDGEASILDDQEIVFTKQKVDLGFLNEQTTLDNTKILLEIPQVEETFARTVSYSRDFSEQVNSEETASFSITAIKEDTFSTTDEDHLENSLNKTESTAASSSGSLISQGYTVDNTYFLEDYVGFSRLFA